MTTHHPHVLELVRFEEQRLGTSITWGSAVGQGTSPRVVVCLPLPDTVTCEATCQLADGTERTLHLARLAGASFAFGLGFPDLPVTTVEGHVVRLALDPSRLAWEGEQALVAHIWDAAVVPALKAAFENARDNADARHLDELTRLEERAWQQTRERLPSEIENLRYEVERVEADFRQRVVRLTDLRRQERALRDIDEDSLRAAAEVQHAALRKLVPSTYDSIEVDRGRLVGRIDSVVIEEEEQSVDVGRFEVAVDLERAAITIRNVTTPVHGCQHPHVKDPGNICWGNLQPGVVRLLAEREWAALLTVVHQFLHAYNPRDAFARLDAWDPTYDEDGEDNDDDTAESEETFECSLCADSRPMSEETVVQNESVCEACIERDTFVCATCRQRFTSRDEAQHARQCTSCWDDRHFECPACHASKPIEEKCDGGSCHACYTACAEPPPATATEEAAL